MKNKADKVKSAQERVKDYATLTTAQKLVKLDMKFGIGLGAAKERLKLAAKLIAEKTVVKVQEKSEAKSNKPYQKPKRS